MEDREIINMYWKRSEQAISETSKKYARYCHVISFNILHDNEDADECVNDTFLRAWYAIPPARPSHLAAFLGKIARNLSLDKYRGYTAAKRGGGQTSLALAELEGCLPSAANVGRAADEIELAEALNRFLSGQPPR